MTTPTPHAPIKIVAVSGSVRPGAFTTAALNVAVSELRQHDNVQTTQFDPAQLDLALPGTARPSPTVDQLKQAITDATGVILATPEYHGSYSSVIKLVIDNLGFPSVLAGKPVSLVGVAAGQIGAIKALEHLRSVCSHVGAIVLPGPTSIAGVQNAFDEQGNCTDPAAEKRLRRSATTLLDYIHNHICPKLALEQIVRGD